MEEVEKAREELAARLAIAKSGLEWLGTQVGTLQDEKANAEMRPVEVEMEMDLPQV